MIRLIFTVIYMIFFYIISIVMLPLGFIVKKCNPKAGDYFNLKFVQWAFKCVQFFSGTRITALHTENIPTDRPVLFVGNHRSIFDIVCTYPLLPTLTGFISKSSMEKVPVISTWMKRLYCLFMDRDDMKQSLKVILTSIEELKSGVSIFIYPEGTRNKTTDPLLDFKAGSFKPAEKTKAPVVPVAITYDKPVFEDHFPKLYKTRIVVQFGKPIETEGLSKEELKHLPQLSKEAVMKMLQKNQSYL